MFLLRAIDVLFCVLDSSIWVLEGGSNDEFVWRAVWGEGSEEGTCAGGVAFGGGNVEEEYGVEGSGELVRRWKGWEAADRSI